MAGDFCNKGVVRRRGNSHSREPIHLMKKISETALGMQLTKL
jgi:hypothetical protein